MRSGARARSVSALLGAIGGLVADLALAADETPYYRLSFFGQYKPFGTSSSCVDVNDAGSTVGTTDGKMYRAIDYRAGPPFPELPAPPGSPSPTPIAIDGSNTVLVRGGTGGVSRAFLYGASYSEIDKAPEVCSVFPMALSDTGYVVGRAIKSDNQCMPPAEDRAFRWKGSTMTLLDDPSGVGAGAFDVNDSGTVVGVAGGHAATWNPAGTLLPEPVGAFHSQATSIDAVGRIFGDVFMAEDWSQMLSVRWNPPVVDALTPLSGLSLVIDSSDAGDVLIQGETEVVLAHGDTLYPFRDLLRGLESYGDVLLVTPRAMSGDGHVCGDVMLTNGRLLAFAAYPDRDGDGLADSWETEGIPFASTAGGFRYFILPGADPDHKNLYVELDRMQGLTFPPESVEALRAAFAAAPVANPDGEQGITLTVLVDDATLPFEQVTSNPSGFPPSAAGLRDIWFGTSAEHDDPDEAKLLEAKAKAFRYALLMNKASREIGGIGELAGDDFILFAGIFSAEGKAAIFMHELGHTLGLGHGGRDDINGKTNYPSVMNYLLTYSASWNRQFWRLDYSREVLMPVDELALSEPAPIGGAGSGYYENWLIPFSGVVAADAACQPPEMRNQPAIGYARLAKSAPSADFNFDCDLADTGVTADLNYMDIVPVPSPGQIFFGWNDWEHIGYEVHDGGGSFAGPVPPDELTETQRAWMEANLPLPTHLFYDGFESGTTAAWAHAVP